MFTITASNVYGANQIAGAQAEAERLGYNLTVFQNNFSQPEQDQQVQQYLATGAQPATLYLRAATIGLPARRMSEMRAPIAASGSQL